MELNNLVTNTDIIKVLATVLASLVLVGFNVLVAEFTIVKPLARAWAKWRGHMPEVVEQVNETTDPANVKLAHLTGIPVEVWAVALPVFFNALAQGLDAALKQQAVVNVAPPQEAIPPVEQPAA